MHKVLVHCRAVSLIAIAILLLAAFSFAQSYTDTIRGTVTDPSGATVPGASVTVSDTNTGLTRSMSTGTAGEFEFVSLPIGTYKIAATAKGFRGEVQTGLDLHVNDIKLVTMKLTVGPTSESVTVEANPVAVETQTGQVAGLIDGTQVRELPMNGRNFMQLTQLQPGVAQSNQFNATSKGLGGSVAMSVSGSWGNGNLWMVDGANNNDYGSNRTVLVYPSIDNIAEFKILRNSYGPEFGQAAGGVINIVTRSGSNNFHGSAYYFGRNDALNARDWFLANNNKPIAPLRRNDFGYTIGGPIKKDKLFFFWSQEWNREIRGFTRSAIVPTVNEKQGIFSTGCLTTAQPVNPFNPGTPLPDMTAFSAGGQAYLQIFPDPNVTVPCPGPTRLINSPNWVQAVGSKDNWREESIRADYNINAHNTFMVRFSNDSWVNPGPNGDGTFGLWGDDPYPVIESSWSQPSRSLSAKLTTSGSTIVNEFQASWGWNAIMNTFGGSTSINQEIAAHIPAIYAADKVGGSNPAYPVFWGSPYGTLWEEAPWHNRQSLINVRDSFSKVHTRHTFKAGAYFATNLKDELNGGGGFNEAIQLGGVQGPLDPETGRPLGRATGNWVADLLFPGNTYSFSEKQKSKLAPMRWRDLEFYAGDSWRVAPRFTVEAGLRWSLYREPFVANDAIASFDPTTWSAANAGSPCNGLVLPTGSEACAGFPGATFATNRSIRPNTYHTIAPRLGFAFDPTGSGKWAIRGGLGQFFQRERINALLGLSNQSPFVAQASGTRFLDTITQPYPGAISTAVGSIGFGVAPLARVPNTWQWNFTVERELLKDVKLETAYVGSHGVHQLSAYNANQDNTFTDLGRQVWIYADTASSIYHSLQMQLSGRKHNMQWQAAYTWSKLISDSSMNWFGEIQNGKFDAVTDIHNPGMDRGLSQLNRPHIFAFNLVYTLPTLADTTGFVKNTLGGWEVATIIQATSGNSISVFNDTNHDRAGTGTPDNQRPNLVAGQTCKPASGAPELQIINPNLFSEPASGTFGNAPRGVCPGPGYANVDLALYKNFGSIFKGSKLFTEGMKIQFRLEAFNTFNHPQFTMGVNNNVNFTGGAPGAGFGQATSARPGREIQYALKFIF